MRRLAVLSLHTSPLAQPGTGDGGGMNVYVRELSSALARAGVACDVFTRAWSDDLASMVDIEPGFRVHYVSAGPPRLMAKEALPDGGRGVHRGRGQAHAGAEDLGADGTPPSTPSTPTTGCRGMAGHALKHRARPAPDSTFHTLDRVKAEASPEELDADAPHRRAEAEAAIVGCSDAVLASCSVEADPARRAVRGRPVPHPRSWPRASTTPSSARATGARPVGPSGWPAPGRCSSSSGASSP